MEIALIWLPVILPAVAVLLLLVLLFKPSGNKMAELETLIRAEFRESREDSTKAGRELREEVNAVQKASSDSLVNTVAAMGKAQQENFVSVERRIKELTDSNENRIEKLRHTFETQMNLMQQSNEKKLDQMRQTVDEKLQSTLEKRLGESFKQVSERLEAVQRGLGEMQSLATGVGDLKRVLTNVKARGTWGEVQLGALLEQILTHDQYAQNVKTVPGSQAHVEYAIKLPGADDDPQSCVWLPIDSKFPQEDYQRLVDATEKADVAAVEKSQKDLVRAIEFSAKEISGKYLAPPHTTDFAILFLPTEGLYAEIIRQPGLLEKLQHDHRIVVAGPTTLTATLSSLRMGFKTLAIEKRSSEVWSILSAVKTEFGKFGDVLERVKSQLATASKTIDSTSVRTRAMEKQLRNVEQMPVAESELLLGIVEDAADDSAGEMDDLT